MVSDIMEETKMCLKQMNRLDELPQPPYLVNAPTCISRRALFLHLQRLRSAALPASCSTGRHAGCAVPHAAAARPSSRLLCLLAIKEAVLAAGLAAAALQVLRVSPGGVVVPKRVHTFSNRWSGIKQLCSVQKAAVQCAESFL